MLVTRTHHQIGAGSARAVVIVMLAYITTGVVWWFAEGDPLRRQALLPLDPYLAILEALIVLACPLMVVTMAAVHACAPREKVTYSAATLGFMTLLAGITGGIHFVDLVAIRRLGDKALSGLAPVVTLPWHWPSMVFALDLFAWDLFFGLSMICGAQVFQGGRTENMTRRVMMLSGVMCIAGLLGPVLGDLRFQLLAIIGYAGVGPVAFWWLSRALSCTRCEQA